MVLPIPTYNNITHTPFKIENIAITLEGPLIPFWSVPPPSLTTGLVPISMIVLPVCEFCVRKIIQYEPFFSGLFCSVYADKIHLEIFSIIYLVISFFFRDILFYVVKAMFVSFFFITVFQLYSNRSFYALLPYYTIKAT